MEKTYGKIMRWDDFRELIDADAHNWYCAGWRSNDLEIEDILNDYPEDYFIDSPDDDYDELSSFFTPEEIGEKTLERLEEIEEEKKKKKEEEEEEEEE